MGVATAVTLAVPVDIGLTELDGIGVTVWLGMAVLLATALGVWLGVT